MHDLHEGRRVDESTYIVMSESIFFKFQTLFLTSKTH